MEDKFDKHGWLKAVQRDASFSDREFRLAFVIANQFTKGNGIGWPVELERVADAITGGFTQVKLRKGLKKLRDAGYLVETYRRSTGPGLTAKRSHNLCQLKNTETVGLQCYENTETVRSNTDTLWSNTDTVRLDTDTVRFSQTWSDQPEGPPKGTLEGTYKGTSEGTTNGSEGTESGFTCSRCQLDFSVRPFSPSRQWCKECTQQWLKSGAEEEIKDSLEEERATA